MKIQLVNFNSGEYEEMKALRVEALLTPIGIPASYIVPDNEKNDVFIGAFEDGKIIGCCILSKKNEDVVQLRQMAVHPIFPASVCPGMPISIFTCLCFIQYQ